MYTMALNPGVYKIVHDKIANSYYLVYHKDRFTLPEKIYGDTVANVTIVWNHFALNKASTGVMLLGNSGTGKSLFGEKLSNIALDNNLPVILCTEIVFKEDLLAFLATMNNCVIFLDEFSKNIKPDVADKMLTMLSDTTFSRLFVITENESLSVSRYIRDRPGRVRYRYDYERVSVAVYDDYLKDHDVKPEFKKELDKLYKGSSVFSFDHLRTIVSEHINYPDTDLDILMDRLNVNILKKKSQLVVFDVKEATDSLEERQKTKYYKFIMEACDKGDFKRDGDYITYKVFAQVKNSSEIDGPIPNDKNTNEPFDISRLNNFAIYFTKRNMEYDAIEDMYTVKDTNEKYIIKLRFD